MGQIRDERSEAACSPVWSVRSGALTELLGTTAATCLLFGARPRLQGAVPAWIYLFGVCLHRIGHLNPII